VDDWLWVWIGAAVVFAVIELVTPVLFFAISFAIGAVLAALAALVDLGVGFQWALFLLGTAGSLAVLVPIGRRIARAEGDDEAQGSSRWVGRVAVVLDDIPRGPHATGLVRLERREWRAETDGDEPISEGTEVEVLAVRGTRLVVAPLNPSSDN
jgi:membrane protein implicated in regulation of membrane protease activity